MTSQNGFGLALILWCVSGALLAVGVVWGVDLWQRWRWRREVAYRAKLARRVFSKGGCHEK